MHMAISEGLSESVIMEVIDDVTASGTPKSTPRKSRLQPAVVDLTRTPRARPDQLAVGFNYLSDVVIKESPKTVGGEIIVLDSLPRPRDRPEQLALGFNFHADQLVKASPRSETGEVMIPGVVLTPQRRTRDQLAVGFNYHSDCMVMDGTGDKENQPAVKPASKTRRQLTDNVLGEKTDNKPGVCNKGLDSRDDKDQIRSPSKKGRRSLQDTVAIGFSYNSDVILKQSLSEMPGTGMSEHVTGLMEDAAMDEGRNMAEVAVGDPCGGMAGDNIGPLSERRPAGSVW